MTPRCGYDLYNLYIYLSEECNLACRHCWQSALYAKQLRKHAAPASVYLSFIDEAIPLGLQYVKLSGGEPLLRKDVAIAILEHVHARGLRSRLETNGTLLDDEMAAVIRRCGAGVSMSLDGASAEVHERMRLVPGAFDATVAAMARLHELGVRYELVLSLHGGNLQDVPRVVALGARHGCVALKINPVVATGRGSKMAHRGELLDVKDLRDFVQDVDTRYGGSRPHVSVAAAPAFHSLSAIRRQRVAGGHCNFKRLLGVLADGRVSFCAMGYRARRYVFMQAGQDSCEAVWNEHPLLQQVRASIPSGLQGVCGNCVFNATCQGDCRAFALEVYDSITAPAPACQALYDAGLFPASRLVAPRVDAHYEPGSDPRPTPVATEHSAIGA